MAKSKSSKIEPVHVAEAERLKALFAERTTLSQQKFGTDFDIGTQGMVWQFLNARSPLHLEVAIKFARGLQCAVRDFSPRLADALPADLPSAQPPQVGTTAPPAPVTKVPDLSGSSSSQTATDSPHSPQAPTITYEVIRGVVAGALQGLGVSYEDLIENEAAARQRIEAALRPAAPPEENAQAPEDNAQLMERRRVDRRKAQSWRTHTSAPAAPRKENRKRQEDA